MKQRTETYFNRKAIDFRTSKVEQVLPDYFKEDYPNLIKFLEYYYEFMDSDGTHSFNSDIRELMVAKDIELTSLSLLDNIFKEVGLGTSQDFFTNPRQAAALFAKFFRVKGSLYSAEGFFRAFFNEQPTISYPKEDIFKVGESEIGSESIKYLTDNKLYQTFSILIKAAAPVSKWSELYKQFAHPAGWYFEGQVQLEGIGDLLANDNMPLPGIIENLRTLVSSASTTNVPFTSMSALYADTSDSDSVAERLDLNAIIDVYDHATVEQLQRTFSNIEDVADLQSHTMDDSDRNVGTTDSDASALRLSTDLEKMDKDNYDI
jgi:hypothetical protein